MTPLVKAAVDAADLALRLGASHPDFMLQKMEMDQLLAQLTAEEKKEFTRELDSRRGTTSFRLE